MFQNQSPPKLYRYNRFVSATISAGLAEGKTIGEGLDEMDKIARTVIDEAGYKGCFEHSLGHGVGLYIHEAPRFSASAPADSLLSRGHVVTVEPGIYLENRFGVRIEDVVIFREGGHENITASPKNLIIV